MPLRPGRLPGLFLIAPTESSDERGGFARWYDASEVAADGADATLAQVSVSTNRLAGTLRGLHYQREPASETKVVRCLRGRAFDVVADLRQGSPTYLQWESVDLVPGGVSVLVPPGCAHGFITLENDTDLLYQISTPYQPELAAGVRWDDPSLGVSWPVQPTVMSERDSGLPYAEAARA